MCRICWVANIWLLIVFGGSLEAIAQSAISPAMDDLPEEVLRTEIFTEARSPIDGKLLNAAEYIELQEDLATLPDAVTAAMVSPKLRELIELLKLRRSLRQIIPFIP
jgi:hypothetical protein